RRKAPASSDEHPQLAALTNAGTDDQTGTDEEDDTLAGLSAWSVGSKRNLEFIQELGAAMSRKLEGFDIREELGKIKYAQGIINEGFGQRGAFANIQE
ncbi:unnamed protein product, partial [Sphacelaria rigidula]